MTIRFTVSGNREYYASYNGVTWWKIDPESATHQVEKGAELQLT